MARKRDNPYIYVSWLPQIMVGSKVCQWGAWYKTHNTQVAKVSSDFDSVTYNLQHTQMVDKIVKYCTDKGDTVSRENQNWFNVSRSSGTVISGKPDIVALDSSGYCVIYDAKTGDPQEYHKVQVMLYMMLLPYWSRYKGVEPTGYLWYKNTEAVKIPFDAIDEEFQKLVTYLYRHFRVEYRTTQMPQL